MEPNASQQDKQEELERLIETLPEELQSLCASGKAVLNMAHLAKNLLQMVSGSAEITQLSLERREYDRITKSWNIFEMNLSRLKKLVLDLIRFTKQYPLHAVSCDINEIIAKAAANCERLLKENRITLQFRPGTEIPTGCFDIDRLTEITINLITHAADNVADHGGNIVLRTAYLHAGKEFELSIEDDAPALSLDIIKLLRVPNERTRNMRGTGFEIPLAGLYAQQHGGYMDIDSTPPRGNAVHIYLPLHLS
jgi:signal transduction histidine kinase